MIVDLYLVYSFIKRLATPFEKWKAFELGIIDKDGNVLKKRSSLNTVAERDAFGIFDQLVLKLKVLLEKIPGGKSRIGTYAAALWLIKESEDLKSIFDMNDEELTEDLQRYMNQINEEMSIDKKFSIMIEDAPAVNVGGGAIAGAGVGPDGEPGVSKKKQKKIQLQPKVIKRYVQPN